MRDGRRLVLLPVETGRLWLWFALWPAWCLHSALHPTATWGNRWGSGWPIRIPFYHVNIWAYGCILWITKIYPNHADCHIFQIYFKCFQLDTIYHNMKPRSTVLSLFSGAPMLTPTPMACHTGDDRSAERSFWLLASERA